MSDLETVDAPLQAPHTEYVTEEVRVLHAWLSHLRNQLLDVFRQTQMIPHQSEKMKALEEDLREQAGKLRQVRATLKARVGKLENEVAHYKQRAADLEQQLREAGRRRRVNA